MRPLPLDGAMLWTPGSLPRQEAIEKLSRRHGQRIFVRFHHDRSADVLGLRWLKLIRFRVQPGGEVTLIESHRSRHGYRTLVAMILGAALVVTGVIVGIATGNDNAGRGGWRPLSPAARSASLSQLSPLRNWSTSSRRESGGRGTDAAG